MKMLCALLVVIPCVALAMDGSTAPVSSEVDVRAPGHGAAPAEVSKALRVGVVGVQESAKSDGDKLASYFSKRLARPAVATVFKSYDAVANALIDGSIDVAWMPPLQGWNAKLGGATLVAKLTRKGVASYRSVFFTRPDSKLTALKDVKDARVGWVEQNSATGHVFALATVAREGLSFKVLFKEQKFLGNHDAVCQAVEKKEVDLAATFADEPPKGKPPTADGCKHALGLKRAAALKVLAMSDPVPSDVVGLRKGIDATTAAGVKKAVLALPSSPDGKKVLKEVLKADGTVETTEADFEPIQRALEAASRVEEDR